MTHCDQAVRGFRSTIHQESSELIPCQGKPSPRLAN